MLIRWKERFVGRQASGISDGEADVTWRIGDDFIEIHVMERLSDKTGCETVKWT